MLRASIRHTLIALLLIFDCHILYLLITTSRPPHNTAPLMSMPFRRAAMPLLRFFRLSRQRHGYERYVIDACHAVFFVAGVLLFFFR